jgi:hypothetical protein
MTPSAAPTPADPAPVAADDDLTPRERRALTAALRDLGALDQLDDLAPAFATRGILALQYLGERAEDLFDTYFWSDRGDVT